MADEGMSAAAPAPAVHLEAVQSKSLGDEECGVATEHATFAAANDRRNADIAAVIRAQEAFRCPQN